ncbi:MAG: VWA domain-containing protein [Thermoplasmata archaeon]
MYDAEISRRNPALIIFLIDQSRSMIRKIGGGTESKAKEAADAINRQIGEIILRSTKNDGVRDYFYISVIGYGGEKGKASFLLDGDVVPISTLADNPLRTEKRTMKIPDGMGGLSEVEFEFGVWFEPVANSDTPMVKAMKAAKDIVENWKNEHENSYPPIIINITDGQSTDGDPSKTAKEIIDTLMADGNPMVWNCHISSEKADPVSFPSSESDLPNDLYAKLLFNMSSELPPRYIDYAIESFPDIKDNARAYVFNAQLEQMIEFINIGTRGALSSAES